MAKPYIRRRERLRVIIPCFLGYLAIQTMLTYTGGMLTASTSLPIEPLPHSRSLLTVSKDKSEESEKNPVVTTEPSIILPESSSTKSTDKMSSTETPDTNQTSTKSSSSKGKSKNCTVAAIEQFPKPLMSFETRKNGGLILHILATLYLFLAIAIVCDDFFVPSLEMICDRMELSEDVAGATFMAAGSSAPELATAVIAVFVAKDDIGISGVIGSAVFNILFVISVCAIGAGHVVHIRWWPLIRDCFCYCVSICALLITICNEVISWYESIFLLTLYGLYIVLMFFNKPAEAWANTLNLPFKNATRDEKSTLFNKGVPTDPKSPPNAENPQENGPDSEKQNMEVESAGPKSMARHREEEEDKNPWEMPVGLTERIQWGLSLPLVAIHHVTVPDCRKVRFRRWYMATFIGSMVWIAIYSYVMVWMITVIGFTMGIPDTVMGLTLIAIGVSVPDAISSLCVVKQGFGDMAVTNAIGSNVFDILVCLGIPWFLKTAIVDPGSVVTVESKGLTYSTLSLFSTVVFLIAATHFNGWKLDFKYGVVLLVWYVLFMIFASLYELNVFGVFNLPVCQSSY